MKTRLYVFGPKRHNHSFSLVRRIALRAMRELKMTGELEIIIADARLMRQLNLRYRFKDYPADVLAFSYDTELRGQIFLLQSMVRDVSQLTRLLVHAIVHIKGYNHNTEKAARRMLRVEEKILKLFMILCVLFWA